MKKKNNLFLIIAFFYVIYTIFPLFSALLPIPAWLPSIFVFTVLLITYPKAFKNNTFYWFCVYAAVLIIYLLAGRRLTVGIGTVADSYKILIEFAFILPSVSIFSVLVYLDDKELMEKFIKWCIVFLFASFIVEYPLIRQYQSLREVWSGSKAEETQVLGLPGYTLMHAYTLFLPTLCFMVRSSSGKMKILSVLGLAVLCFIVYSTYVTTSFIIMIGILIISFAYKENSSSTLIIIGIIVYVLYKVGFFISMIDWIMPWFEGTSVEPKLLDFRQSMILGEATGGSITSRQDLHGISWDSFFQNPLFGTSKAGGHSSLLDRFGGMGIIGGLPFLMIILSFVFRMKKMYQTRMARAFFRIGIVAGFVFLYEKGLWGSEGWLFYMVLMPFGIMVIEKYRLKQKTDLHCKSISTN